MKIKVLLFILISVFFLINSTGADEAFVLLVDFAPPQTDFLIYSAEDLKGIEYKSGRDHDFHLMNDIEITDEFWNPIGSSKSPFSGTFHGNNHTITFTKGAALIQSHGMENGGCGLFGYINHGRVYDLTLVLQGNLTSDENNTGVLVGIMNGNYSNSTPSSALINCIVSADGYSVTGVNNTGGLVGYIINGSIENCSSDCSAVSEENNAGGLAGYVFNGSFVNSSAAGAVKAVGNAGGLIGQLNTGIISGSSAAGSVRADNSAGGFIGYVSDAVKISSSSADGSVKPAGEFGNFIGAWKEEYKPEVTDCLYQGKDVTLEPAPPETKLFKTLFIGVGGLIVLIAAVFILYSKKK